MRGFVRKQRKTEQRDWGFCIADVASNEPCKTINKKRNANQWTEKQIMAITSTAAAYVASLLAPNRLLSLKPVGTFVRHRVQQFPFVRKYTPVCIAVLNSNEIATEIKEKISDLPPPGCRRIKVELSKPLGIVLEEGKGGNIFVAKLVKDGNADKSGLVDVGDQLIATSAIVYGSEEDYQGVRVRKGMQIVQLNVRGERFETVMAAIGTHPGHIKVTLALQKCKEDSPSVKTIDMI